MSVLSKKTVLVYDNGLFLPLAHRLARDFGRVLYFTPWEFGFSIINDNIIGDGYDDIQRVQDIWPLIDAKEVDLVCFPDIQNAGLQLHLEKLGIPVWGSRRGDRIEWDREFFKSEQKKMGMPQPIYRVLIGLKALREYLRENDNCYIKFSKYRSMMETRKHINYPLSEQWLDQMECKYSAVKNGLHFVVEDSLKTDIEIGWDGVCVDGRFPDACSGFEIKDCGYAGFVRPWADLPPELKAVQEKFAPYLKQCRYRNQFSTEVRVKDGKWYFTDPTCRQASPAGEPFQELCSNFGEVVWEGAQGNLMQPEFESQCAVQCIIRHNGDHDTWRPIEVPDNVRRWVKLYRACHTGEADQIVPMEPHFSEVGSVIGIGKDFEEAMENVKNVAEAMKDNPIEIDTESLYHAIKEIKSAKKEGIDLTDSKIPKPEAALEQ